MYAALLGVEVFQSAQGNISLEKCFLSGIPPQFRQLVQLFLEVKIQDLRVNED